MHQQELELENTQQQRTELTNEKEDGELVGSICEGPDSRRAVPSDSAPLGLFLAPFSLTSSIPLGPKTFRFAYQPGAHRASMEKK